ncbi:MAG: dihydrolipoamide acetyltransferase family protein, partial [Terracidiphilus sp.]
QVNTVVAVIADNGADAADAAQPATAAPKDAPGAEEAVAASSGAPPAAPSTSSAPASPASPASAEKHVKSSPLVRRIAKDNNLNLEQIPGTGPQGRITKEDVLHHLEQLQTAAQSAASAPAAASSQPPSAALPSRPAPPSATAAVAAQPAAPMTGETVPLSKMRGLIAQHMVESWRSIPHVHTVFKVDMTRIVRLREHEKSRYEQRNGVKLTYMPFIAVAAVETLRKFPVVNASFENNAIHYHQNVNLGIAVALEWGLIVPVVKQAEERNFLGFARAIADLAERARGKRLKPDEASGSTFTLTNSGIFGEEFGMPIINHPDSAILAIGGLKKEPVVVTGAHGDDSIAIRSMQHFCLGFDHRMIDGADAGRFMSEFKKTLENWDQDIG